MNKAIVAVVVLLFSSMLIFRDTLAPILQFVFYVIAVIIALIAVLGFVFVSHTTVEKMRLRTIERKRNRYQTHQDGFGMLHLIDVSSGIVENLSTYPGTHHNGHWEEPHPAAAAAWFALVGKARSESPANLLMPPEPKKALDLLTIMTQPTQSYALIGGQQVGKTYQARRIANHWSQRGIKPLVIGPKWDKGEWLDCIKVGGEYDFAKVLGGMNAVKRLAAQRHADTDRGHKDHPVQPIFFDDWTAIRAKLDKEAEEFIVDATTLYASVNIILYFIIHLDTANAWGVGKVGAALKQNFIKLVIEPGFTSAGIIDRSKNVGYILMPGQTVKDRQRVALFTEYGRQAIEPDLIIQPVTDKQAQVVQRWQAGERNPRKIAREVYGPGSRQVELVQNAIEKFCG